MKESDGMADKVRIHAMGTFSIEVNGIAHENLPVRTRKGVALLLYLILERGKAVSSQRLIREMWAGRNDDAPENALKTMICRTRLMLNTLSPGLGACVASTSGGYRWQDAENVTVDVLEVMELFSTLQGDCPDEVRAQLTERLQEIYQGDLYSTGEVHNDIIMVNHLHREYLECVLKYVAQLRKKESYNRLCEVCRQAMRIDNLDEQLHIELMQAMANLNRAGEAMTEYKKLARNMQNTLGEDPSDEVRACYNRLAEAGNTLKYNLDTIRNELTETASDRRGPFFCDYQAFKEIYNIQLRNLERLGSTIFLGMIMLGTREIRSVPFPGKAEWPVCRKSCGRTCGREISSPALRTTFTPCCCPRSTITPACWSSSESNSCSTRNTRPGISPSTPGSARWAGNEKQNF